MSESESVRYDRQIRLWGKQTQQRLLSTHAFFTTVRGAASEVAKNLVLAGVRAVTLADDCKVSTLDLQNNFLLQGCSSGDNKLTCGEASRERLSALNPHVSVRQVAASGGSIAPQGDGMTVVFHEIESITGVSTFLSNHQFADVVVMHATEGYAALSLFFYKHMAESLEEQWHALVTQPQSLGEKPAIYQKVVLMLHVCAASPLPAPQLILKAYATMHLLALHELTAEDVMAVVHVAMDKQRRRSRSAVLCTQVGASVAQHVIQAVGHGGGTGAQPVRWEVSTASPMECVVGFA